MQTFERAISFVGLVLDQIWGMIVGGLPLSLVVVGAIAAAAGWTFPRPGEGRYRLFWLLLLTVPWIVTAAAGGVFAATMTDSPGADIVDYLLLGVLAAESLLAAALVALLYGARLFAALVGFVNLFITLLACAMTAMSVHDTWL